MMDDLAKELDSEPLPSVIDEIKRKREELSKKKTIVLEVPGYGGYLAVRYKVIDRDQLLKLFKRLEQAKGKEEIEGNADLLIRCCSEILVRQGEEKEWEPIDPGGESTTFNSESLRDLLGFEAGTAREAVFGLFSPDGAQPTACFTHVEAIGQFLNGQNVDEELLGE